MLALKLESLLEPKKARQVVCMSTMKRSRSWEWATREKPTLDNLYTDKTALRMLERLKSSLASNSDACHSPIGSSMDVTARPPRRPIIISQVVSTTATTTKEKQLVR